MYAILWWIIGFTHVSADQDGIFCVAEREICSCARGLAQITMQLEEWVGKHGFHIYVGQFTQRNQASAVAAKKAHQSLHFAFETS